MLEEQDQAFFRNRARVARILLEHAEDGGNGKNRLSQREIATILGINIYIVHASIQSLYSEGIIRIECHRIIVNKELLQKAAGIAYQKQVKGV